MLEFEPPLNFYIVSFFRDVIDQDHQVEPALVVILPRIV
jgi:hypothetical protein